MRDDPRTDIRGAALKALELDPSLAEAYVALAFTARTVEDRRIYLDSALVRNPNDTWAVYFSAMLYDGVGQPERAIRQMNRLLVIEPLSPKSYYMNANLLNGVGQHARADSLASIGLAIDSLSLGEKLLWPGYWNRAWALLMLGNYELAGVMLQHKALVVRDSNATGLDTVIAGIAAVRRKTPGWKARRAAALRVLAAHERDWEAGVGDAYWKRPCGMFTFDCHWVPVYHALLEDGEGMFVSLEKWPVDAPGLCTPVFLWYKEDSRLQRLQREAGIQCAPQALE